MDPEITGGADASADHIDVSADQVANTPNPILDREPDLAPAPDAKSAKKPTSIDDALDRAAAKVAAKDKDGETDPKDLKKGADLARGEGGKFAPKDGKPADPVADKGKVPATSVPAAGDKPIVDANAKPGEPGVGEKVATADPNAKPSTAPARFSPDAKAVWDTAPEPVKAEVARMERELTAGIEKHRVQAEKYEPIKPYEKMATDAGTTVHAALKNYTDLDKLMHTNPLKGIETICERSGVSLRDLAKIVLGEPVDQQQSQSEATVRDLKNQVSRLEQQLGGVTQRFQQHDEGNVLKHIQDFAADKPLFEVLAPHIVTEMNESGLDLGQAYEAVLQKHPQLAAMVTAPVGKKDPVLPAASDAAEDDEEAKERAAQTRKGSKSINGAPGSGSHPGARKRSKSIDEALERAFADAG